MKANRAIKLVAVACFVLLALALLTIRSSPATGYEGSIYTATPPTVWYYLIISIACGIGIVVHQVYYKQENRNLWVIGLGLILLSTTIILSLHILRGYALWACTVCDPGSHLGYIQDVIASGHTESIIFYPVTHIYLAQLSLLTDTSPILWHKWIPVLFALFYMVFIYFMAKSVLPDKRQVILATIAGTALMCGWYLNLTPNHLSNLLFPLALYLLIRSFTPGTIPWKILFLIMVFLYPAFHPVPVIALLIALWTISLPRKLFLSFGKETLGFADSRFRFNASVSILLLVFTITWISSFYIWGSIIKNIQVLITEGGPTPFTQLIALVGPGLEHTYSVAWQFFLQYTSIIVYIVLALAAFPILLKKRADRGNYSRLLGLYAPLAIIALIIVGCFFFQTMFGPLRFLIYIIMLCTIFTGFTLFELMEWTTAKGKWLAKITAFLVVILLLAVSINGIVKVYPSRYVLLYNYQTTQTEIDGMDFLLHNKDTEYAISSFSIAAGRFSAFLMTPEERKQDTNIPFSPGREEGKYMIPYHFGYDKYMLVGQSYNEDMYLAINQRDRIRFTEISPELAYEQFYSTDFDRLENDISIDKLYANSGFDMWYVHAMRQTEASSSS